MNILAKQNNTLYWVLPIISSFFLIIGFGIGISGFLTPFLQDAFRLTNAQSYLVTAAIFSAFIIFGAPAGLVFKKYGYKRSMLIAFFIMALGMFLFIPSANRLNFPLFLLALFIGGIGNTLLQASVNPYVTILGPMESAARRMSLMGIMNKSAWWLSSLFLGIFLDLNNVNLNDIILPFYIVTGILILLGISLFFIPLPELEAEKETSNIKKQESSVANKNIFQYPHLLLGVLALFLYVGIETLPMVSVIGYSKAIFGETVENLDQVSIYVPLGLIIGYLFGLIAIPKYMSQTRALIAFSFMGILSSLLLIFLPSKQSIYSMILIGFSNSLMWPAIWPLAIADLGKLTKTGSSMLVMGIVGGAIIPIIFGLIIDGLKTAEQASAENYQSAYWIFIPCYIYILFFAAKGNKIRT